MKLIDNKNDIGINYIKYFLFHDIIFCGKFCHHKNSIFIFFPFTKSLSDKHGRTDNDRQIPKAQSLDINKIL